MTPTITAAHIAGLLAESRYHDEAQAAWCRIALGDGDGDDCTLLGLDPDDDNGERAWEVCADALDTAHAACFTPDGGPA
jgi:hypothetical protein